MNLTTEHTEITEKTVIQLDPALNAITEKIINSAIIVHKELGPGLLESAYEDCLFFDLVENKKLFVERQKILPLVFQGRTVSEGFRIDLLVEKSVIVEIKAMDKIMPVHQAQILTYLKLSKLRMGLIINFNEKLIKNGLRRLVL